MDIVVNKRKLSGNIDAISSKSHAQRAIFASILARGKSEIKLDTISKDIEAAISVAKSLLCKVNYENNILHIDSSNKFPDEVVIDVYESGTSFRFLLSLLAVLHIKAKIIRRGSLVKRSNDVLFDLLRESGVDIFEDDKYVYVDGFIKNGSYLIRGDISSQYISSLLMSLSYFKDKSKINISTKLESKPYIDVTVDVLRNFSVDVEVQKNSYIVSGPIKPSYYEVERDWSNSLFFLACGINVKSLNLNSKQADKRAMDFFNILGYENISENGVMLKKLRPSQENRILDVKDMPDSVPILSVFASKEKGHTKFINVDRLKLKESDRIKSTLDLLNKLGVDAKYCNNSIEFNSVDEFNDAKINTYNDHRIAMASIIASCFCKSKLQINGVECINKSYANFIEDFCKLGGDVIVL